MISDTLAEAIEQIQEYLADPEYKQMYRSMQAEIEQVLTSMEVLRETLDRLPHGDR